MPVYPHRFTSFLSALLFVGATVTAHAEQIRMGYLPVTGHAKFFVAKEQGFFRDEGLDVALIEFINSADGINALNAGKLDIAAFGTTAPLAHLSKGAKIKMIGGLMGGDAAIIARAENAGRLSDIANYKGVKIATVRMASGDAVLRGALKDAGLDWKKDLEIFELKSPAAVVEAVKSGQVDAGVVWGPHDIRAEQQGLKVVIQSMALSEGHPCCRLIIAEKRLQDRATWVRFTRAILRAQQFGERNREQTVADIGKYIKLDQTILLQSYTSPNLEQSSDPNLRGVQRFADSMLDSGFITRPVDVSHAVDTSIYSEALNQLANENPDDPFWARLQREFQQRDVL